MEEVNQGNNVGMIQRCKNGDFVIDSSVIRRRQVLSKDTLDGNLFPCCSVCTTADSGK